MIEVGKLKRGFYSIMTSYTFERCWSFELVAELDEVM